MPRKKQALVRAKRNFFGPVENFKTWVENVTCLVWRPTRTHIKRCPTDLFQVDLIFWSHSFLTCPNCANACLVRAKLHFLQKCIENAGEKSTFRTACHLWFFSMPKKLSSRAGKMQLVFAQLNLSNHQWRDMRTSTAGTIRTQAQKTIVSLTRNDYFFKNTHPSQLKRHFSNSLSKPECPY